MKKALSILTAASLLFVACSTSNQIAQQKDYNDDVYYSKARATEISVIAKTTRKNKSLNQWNDNIYNDYNYPEGSIYYSVAPWRSFNNYNRFYDPYYFDYLGYNSWYNMGIGINSPWLYSNLYRNIYGYPYFNSFYGGPVSYNNSYPGYSYGAYSGGYYNTGAVNNDPNYRARPSRGTENIGGLAKSRETIRRDGQGAIMISANRGESYEGNNTSVSSAGRTSSTGTVRERPSRTPSTSNSDMQGRNVDISPRSTPQTYTQPSSGNYSGDSNSSGSSSDGGSRARPARAGN
jgi:hypothetical protein